MTPLVVENEPPVTFLRRKMTGGRFSMGVVIRRYTGTPSSVEKCIVFVGHNDASVFMILLYQRFFFILEYKKTKTSNNTCMTLRFI